MAIFHLNLKTIGRSDGRSATAAAAYRAGERIADERTGLVFDFTRKRGVDGAEILTPDGNTIDRAALWNAVEFTEKRKDAQSAREIEIALPRELTPEQMRALARAFAQEQFVDKGMIADIAYHNLTGTNPHAHILLTLREYGPDGFGKKNRDWNDRALCTEWRERWAEHTNAALERAGHAARIDPRTLVEQAADAAERGKHAEAAALDRIPTIHERNSRTARAHNARVRVINAERETGRTAENEKPQPTAAPSPRSAQVMTDPEFVASMLARNDHTAALWKIHHRQAEAARAWLEEHAQDENHLDRAEQQARAEYFAARSARTRWLLDNPRPRWFWRWRRWRQALGEIRKKEDEAKRKARKAEKANNADALLSLTRERDAARERMAKALTARRRVAMTPREECAEAEAARRIAIQARAQAAPPEPLPDPQPAAAPARRRRGPR